MNPESLIITELEKIGMDLSPSASNNLFKFINLLIQENQKTNLTAITDYQDALIKHIYDSLLIFKFKEFQDANHILDIGSGAGIPCIPLAISSPEKSFTSLDSIHKKIIFQAQICQIMNLSKVKPIWARAEEFIQTGGHRESFDLVIARAVAAINILAELALPFIKVGGTAIFYKGKDYQSELNEAEKAISFLGGRIGEVFLTELPMNYGTRSLIQIKKVNSSPLGYPRKSGILQKKPLFGNQS